ncbi:MAG: ABC transporter ATP-binding protein [Hamadaea sp.]|uniref:ABC transporter ATP-binding protein n=1 Tax=Hamadaea sp. TaxID=2024425 RepID=UPI0018312E92|nr:ABC transporter ATP-binding protein [Hamadaea sp.]NUR73519.1 ABC transporter ATP-binding protein [Hamadaea sp.]NUT22664.1 ABC transporter ATP-binding protein [Hamadaea sp.]
MIETRALTKAYGRRVVVDAVSMTVGPGEFMVVLGPSGCGKSTILRMIAGLEEPTSGEVVIDNRMANNLSARDRGVAMVFQDFALYPHLTARENIAMPLRISHSGSLAEDMRRVEQVAGYFGVADLLERKPAQLSGGQRQRVAVARAIVRDPRAFLLDEPLSQVDAHLRLQLRREIARLARRLRVTTLYVTHDQQEALALADRIVVLESGRVRQIGTPQQISSDPADVFVAGFVGAARTTLVQGAVYVDRRGSSVLDLGEQALDSDRTLPGHHTDRVTVALRTDALRPVPVDAEGPVLRGTVSFVEDLGAEMLVHVATGLVGVPAAYASPDAQRSGGRPVPHQREPLDDLEEPFGELVVRVPAGTRPGVGEAFAVEVDLDRVFLFDRGGVRIRADAGS